VALNPGIGSEHAGVGARLKNWYSNAGAFFHMKSNAGMMLP
jgi:hypothetical protein